MKSHDFTGRSAIALTLILSAVTFSAWLTQGLPSPIAEIDELMNRSHRVLAYQIESARSALFRIQPGETTIELISNLDINNQESIGPEMMFEYALNIAILDADGSEVSERVIWQKTRHSSWMDQQSGFLMTSAFYLNEDRIPCDSRIFKFRTETDSDEIRFLRVQLAEPLDGSASIRAYRHEDMLKGRELSAVLPLKSRLKAKLSRHNLFGNKVKEIELKRFLSDVWQQIPAEGRSGEDYLTRALYLFNDEIPILGEEYTADQLRLDSSTPLLLTVQGPGEIEIATETATTIYYTFLSQACDQQEEAMELDSNTPARIRIPQGKHVASIRSAIDSVSASLTPVPPSVMLVSEEMTNQHEIPVRSTSYYRSNSDSEPAIIVDIPQLDYQEATGPIKIVCRIPVFRETVDESLLVHYEFKDAKHKVIDTGTLEGSVSSSRFARYGDRPIDPDERCPSFPERFFLTPPKSAATLCIWADKPTDVAFFSRLTRLTTILESIDAISDAVDDPLFLMPDSDPQWFYFKPLNSAELKDSGRINPIHLPIGVVELPQRNQTVPAATRFVSLHPVSDANPLYIFDQCPEDTRADNDSVSIVIEPDREVRLRHTSDESGSDRITIRYRLQSEKWSDLCVYLDGAQKLKFRPLTREGIFHLTGIVQGDHSVRIVSSSGKDLFWVRGTDGFIVEGFRSTVRRVYSMDARHPLEIDFTKDSWEPAGLNIVVYLPEDDGSEIDLTAECLEIDDSVRNTVAHRLTVPTRKWAGRVSSGEPLRATTGDFQYRAGNLYFPLQDDVPPGSYHLTLTTTRSEPMYLRFFTRSSNE